MKFFSRVCLLILSIMFLAHPNLVRADSCQNPAVISFPFAVQAGELGLTVNANVTVDGDVYANGDIAGHLFAKVSGNAQASGNITNLQVTGSKTSGAPSLPLPVINLTDWELSAAAGGITGGNIVYPVNSTGNLLGPVKILGNLVLEANSEVTIKGNIYVTGNITVGQNAKLELVPSFGSNGTVIIAQGAITIAGNAHVNGTNSGGFLLIISQSPTSPAIDLGSNFISSTTIFYAPNGELRVGPNSRIIGAYGKKVTIEPNAAVNFVPGLKFASFICPPPPPPPPSPPTPPPPTPPPGAPPPSLPPGASPPKGAATPKQEAQSSAGTGRSYEAILLFSGQAEKIIGQTVAESVVLRNPSSVTLDPGFLSIQFPAETRFVSSDPPPLSLTNNLAAFAVPGLAANTEFKLTLRIDPQAAGSSLVTAVKYTISGALVSYTSFSENIAEAKTAEEQTASGKVAGAQTLPRTGANPLTLVAINFAMFLSFSKRRILAFFAGLSGMFLATNFSYFKKNLTYTFHPPTVIVKEESMLEQNTLRIDALGIAAPIIYVQEASEKIFQQALQDGIVHYPGTASPGEFGNAYFFGHSSDNAWSKGSYKTVFAALPRIKLGDEIRITDKQGKIFSYAVIKTLVTSPNDLSPLDQNEPAHKLLTLQTSYPIGTSLQRFIAVAKLHRD